MPVSEEDRQRRRREELLRRGDVAVHPERGGRGYLYRPRQLFTPKASATFDYDRATSVFEKLGASREDEWDDCSRYARQVRQPSRMSDQALPEQFNWERWFVPPHVDVPAVVDYFRYGYQVGEGEERPRVAPNHVILGNSWWGGEPADDPVPASEGAASMLGGVAGGGGEGILIAILDTGIAADAGEKHPSLSGHFDFDARDVDLGDADGDGDLDREAGHGTFVAGVALGRAPYARFDPVAVLDTYGVGDDLSVSKGIEEIAALPGISAKKLIINLSLGTYTESSRGLTLTRNAIKRLDPEILVVAAAGNAGRTDLFYPAAYKEVVGVGAVDADQRRAWFSNYGWWVDACSYGSALISTYVEGTFPYPDGNQGVFETPYLASWSGTSFASPNVAGAVAARATLDDISVREAYARLKAEGTSVPELGTFIF